MKQICFAATLFVTSTLFTSTNSVAVYVEELQVDKTASISDTNTSIKGISHISLSVKNLDRALLFYQQATDFALVSTENLEPSATIDALFNENNLSIKTAVLKAPNMLLELTQYSVNQDALLSTQPAIGPGMTHTCFQSPMDTSGFNKFIRAGAKMLSRGSQPVDLGGYGVTYAYVYDPEGNMIELEQLDNNVLERAGYDDTWRSHGHDLWMSQVAIATHDIKSLMKYYQTVLGFKPYRYGEYANNSKLDDILNVDDLALNGGWFKLNERSKVMEFWQFVKPETPMFSGVRKPSDLGYSFSLEVGDIQAEYQRLLKEGVEFLSEPMQLGHFWRVFIRDIDGNIFSLRQPLNPASPYALANIESH